MSRWVLHVDLDEFIAAVEVLRRPELAGRPLVVGGRGDPTERGVVATASYEARAFGVGSGMPLRTAARRCPEAVFLPVDRTAYDEASARVMETLRGYGVPVEVLGWDEAFLGSDTDDPQALADGVRAGILAATGLHASVGIGDNKLRAKTATGFAKPRGTFTLTGETWFAVMGGRPVDALWGIGAKTARRLAGLGIRTVAELAATPAATLAAEIGPTLGPWYRRLARGADTAEVDPSPYVPRGHGRETTFQVDLTDWAQVRAEARKLAHAVLADLAGEPRPAVRVGVKVRYAPFETRTRSLGLAVPTREPGPVLAAVETLLGRLDRDRPVRLLGVRVELAAPEPARGNPESTPITD